MNVFNEERPKKSFVPPNFKAPKRTTYTAITGMDSPL
jgi:hypothetical protein